MRRIASVIPRTGGVPEWPTCSQKAVKQGLRTGKPCAKAFEKENTKCGVRNQLARVLSDRDLASSVTGTSLLGWMAWSLDARHGNV
jgi:hypothetical protein